MKHILLVITKLIFVSNFIYSQSPIMINITGECSIVSGSYTYNGIINGKNNYVKIFENNGQSAEFGIGFDNEKWVFYSYGNFSNYGFINITFSESQVPPYDNWISTDCGDGVLTITDDLSTISDECFNNFIVYPNPSNDYIFVNSSNKSQSLYFDYSINDCVGRFVQNGQIQNKESISVKDLKRGLYVIDIYFEGNKVFSTKIIKK